MQMFIAFQQDVAGKSKEVLTYISHCLNAEIREGSIGQQKGWMFVFKDDLRPFNFGGKRKYTVKDEDEVAVDIRNGKSLRQISRERHIAPTTVHTLFDRYLIRHPEAYKFLTRESFTEAKEYESDETGLPKESESEPSAHHSEEDNPEPEPPEHHPGKDTSEPEPPEHHPGSDTTQQEPAATRPETAAHSS